MLILFIVKELNINYTKDLSPRFSLFL